MYRVITLHPSCQRVWWLSISSNSKALGLGKSKSWIDSGTQSMSLIRRKYKSSIYSWAKSYLRRDSNHG